MLIVGSYQRNLLWKIYSQMTK